MDLSVVMMCVKGTSGVEASHLGWLSELIAACRQGIVCFDSVESHELKQRKEDREKRLHIEKRD